MNQVRVRSRPPGSAGPSAPLSGHRSAFRWPEVMSLHPQPSSRAEHACPSPGALWPRFHLLVTENMKLNPKRTQIPFWRLLHLPLNSSPELKELLSLWNGKHPNHGPLRQERTRLLASKDGLASFLPCQTVLHDSALWAPSWPAPPQMPQRPRPDARAPPASPQQALYTTTSYFLPQAHQNAPLFTTSLTTSSNH